MKRKSILNKMIIVGLLGTVVVIGAFAFADKLPTRGPSQQDGTTATNQDPRRGGHDVEILDELVTAGIITAEEQTTIEKALIAEREAVRSNDTEVKTPPVAGEMRLSPFAKLAEEGGISQELADKIDNYLSAQREAAFADKVKPLVDGGTFADADAVKTALDAVKTAMDANREAARPDTDREKVDFKTMTEAERAEWKAKMDAERTAMEAKHDAAVEAVFASLIDDNTLTAEQADALKAFMKDNQPQGKGPEGQVFGGHPGGPR